jgi:hypothetical protein
VIVFWQMSNYEQQFVQTKNSFIYSIVPFDDGTAFAVTYADNSFTVMSTLNNQPMYTITGVSLGKFLLLALVSYSLTLGRSVYSLEAQTTCHGSRLEIQQCDSRKH